MNTERSAGVSRAWRVVALGLAAGIAAHVLLSLRRPAIPSATVVTVRDLDTAAAPVPTDPRLDRVLDTVDFADAKLADVLRSLGDRGHLNVVAEWTGLATADVRPDTPVALHLRAVRWSSALDAALLVADPKHATTWNQHGDLVTLTAANAAAVGPVVTRLYDVQPLVDQAAHFHAGHDRRPDAGCFAPAAGGGNQSQSSQQSADLGADEAMDEIKAFIQIQVAPESWRENGGEIGWINTFCGQLVVTQTEQNHRQTAAALALLAARH